MTVLVSGCVGMLGFRTVAPSSGHQYHYFVGGKNFIISENKTKHKYKYSFNDIKQPVGQNLLTHL